MDVPEVVVERLPRYLRSLTQLLQGGTEVVSSQQLGELLQVTPAQIRKDLSYFGRFGKQGRGYNIPNLIEQLRHILGLDRTWNVALVGVGRLGRAVISYPGFQPEGFRVVACFDADSNVVGQTVGGLTIQSTSDLAGGLAKERVQIVIVAVPSAHAQEVIDALVSAGIKSILNYAPVATQVPPGVRIRNIDPVLAFQSMTYYLTPPDVP